MNDGRSDSTSAVGFCRKKGEYATKMKNTRSYFAFILMVICIFCFCSVGNAGSTPTPTPTLTPSPLPWQYHSFDDQSVFDFDWMNPDYTTAIVGTLLKQQLDQRYASVGVGFLFNCGTPWLEFQSYFNSILGTAYIWQGDNDNNHLTIGGYKYTYNTKSKEWTSERDDSDPEERLKSNGIPYLTVDTKQMMMALADGYPMPTAIPSPSPSPTQETGDGSLSP